jgi:protease-4
MNNTVETTDNAQVVLNKLVLDYMHEKNRKKRWRWVRRFIYFLIFAFLVYQIILINKDVSTFNKKPHVGLIDINGTVFENQPGGSEAFVKSLDAAYKNPSMKALILRINSPGGSPVQAEYMYNSLQYYRKKYPDIKTYAVCVDLCASAAYYVAAGAHEIYASPASMVGSIVVLFNGFGFVDTMQKLGISRRLYTAGNNKGLLDPFSPEKPEQIERLQAMLNIIHQQFITRVKEGRGSKLQANDDLFSGLFWTGEQAKTLGLIDGFGSSGQVARDKIGIDYVIDYTTKQSVFERIAKSMGVALVGEVPKALGMYGEFQ